MYCFFYQDLQVLNYQCLAFCLSGATKRVIRIKEQPHPQLYTAKIQNISSLYLWHIFAKTKLPAFINKEQSSPHPEADASVATWKQWNSSQGDFTKRRKVRACFIPLSLSCNPCLWDNETFLPPTQSLESGTKIGKINTRGHDRRKMGLSCSDN